MGHAETLWLVIGVVYIVVAFGMAVLAGSFMSFGNGGKKPTRCWYEKDGRLHFDED